MYQRNANLPNPGPGRIKFGDSSGNYITAADTNRLFYPVNKVYDGSRGANLNGAYVLTNSNKGDAWSFTIGLARAPRNHFYGSLFYTRMMSRDIAPNVGSTASSVWLSLPNAGSANQVVLSPSDYFRENRFVGSLSYQFNYLKHFATTVSLFFEGYQGGRYSYMFSSDVNGDGNANDLIYIPKNGSEIAFLAYDAKDANNKTVTFTAQQQAEAFEKFISQDKYLNSHRGQIASRNGAKYPYYQSFDFKLLQDIYHSYGKRKYTIQLSADVLNIGNFLNKNWGIQQSLVTSKPLAIAKDYYDPKFPGGVTKLQFRNITDENGNPVLPTSTFRNSTGVGSTWRMQFGVRVLF
ncbi:MAG: hypothetical protein EBZ77_13555 [Chitinophagia bacterium]|nr:hypothetical protein [Chitinophagia bacterium]